MWVMPDFAQSINQATDLTEKQQKKAGKPVAGDIDEEHRNFLKTLIKLIDSGEIRPDDPKSFLKPEVYDKLDEEWHEKTDIALMNIAQQVRLINDFRNTNGAPDESPQLQTMVEQLWQMKQQIEEHHDVFKF